MLVPVDRLKDRFSLLSTDGLTNLKFFIDRRYEMSSADFATEWSNIQDVISAGEIQKIESIDETMDTRKYNAPF